MYVCIECGRSFFEPREALESRNYGEVQAFERWLECPYCAGAVEENNRTGLKILDNF